MWEIGEKAEEAEEAEEVEAEVEALSERTSPGGLIGV